MPDGFKAQVVAIDREAVILFNRALTKVIAEDLMKADGLSEDMVKSGETKVQELTDGYNKRVDDILDAKEADIMTV